MAQFEALELNSLLILRLWHLKFLKICDLGVKVGSWELENAEMGGLQMARRAWKRGPQSRTFPIFQGVITGGGGGGGDYLLKWHQ